MSTIRESCAQCKGQPESLKRCSRCKSTFYCSRECQMAHWKVHKKICEPVSGSGASDAASSSAQPSQKIMGIKIFKTTRHRQPFNGVPLYFSASDPIFSYEELLCPFTALYGIPIIILSPSIHMGVRLNDAGDNQTATYLRIELDRFAPLQWLDHYAGVCYAVRQDKKPLNPELLETMYEFHASLINSDYFEKKPENRPYQITPQMFMIFCEKYWKQQTTKGRAMPNLMI